MSLEADDAIIRQRVATKLGEYATFHIETQEDKYAALCDFDLDHYEPTATRLRSGVVLPTALFIRYVDEFPQYRERFCQRCTNHPDYPLMVLGDLP